MQRRPIHRGGIVSAGYDRETRCLDIEFDTKRVLRYENVGSQVADRFLNSAEPVAYYLADRLSLPVTNIFDCLNFYSELSSKPRAKYPIQVCSSPACRVNVIDTKRLLETLQRLLDIKIGETTYDGRFTLETTTCYGACDRAPSVRINGQIYDHLDTQEKIEALLRSLT